MVISLGPILMGEGGKYCLVSRKSGQKETNVVGEKRIKTFCFSGPYCSGQLGVCWGAHMSYLWTEIVVEKKR